MLAAAGKFGGGIQLTGMNSWLQLDPVQSSSINDIPAGFTIECWFKTDLLEQGALFFRRYGWQQIGAAWGAFYAYFAFWGEDIGNQTQISNPLPADNQWHHIAGAFDPANHVYYMLLDGQLQTVLYQGDFPTASTQVTGYAFEMWDIPFAVGAVEGGGAGYTGYLDGMRMSNIVRYDIPEPTTMTLFGLGLLALLRRKK